MSAGVTKVKTLVKTVRAVTPESEKFFFHVCPVQHQ